MVITEKALELIKATRIKNRLALELGCSVGSVERWIRLNEPNNDLTKAVAVQVISEETKLTDAEILTEVSVSDTAA